MIVKLLLTANTWHIKVSTTIVMSCGILTLSNLQSTSGIRICENIELETISKFPALEIIKSSFRGGSITFNDDDSLTEVIVFGTYLHIRRKFCLPLKIKSYLLQDSRGDEFLSVFRLGNFR